jgi:hypothetical protein
MIDKEKPPLSKREAKALSDKVTKYLVEAANDIAKETGAEPFFICEALATMLGLWIVDNIAEHDREWLADDFFKHVKAVMKDYSAFKSSLPMRGPEDPQVTH